MSFLSILFLRVWQKNFPAKKKKRRKVLKWAPGMCMHAHKIKNGREFKKRDILLLSSKFLHYVVWKHIFIIFTLLRHFYYILNAFIWTWWSWCQLLSPLSATFLSFTDNPTMDKLAHIILSYTSLSQNRTPHSSHFYILIRRYIYIWSILSSLLFMNYLNHHNFTRNRI